ncbi:hypothetical protein BgAZ_502930 [Babesia gibsoni]|uniref:Merozoite surface protein 2 n=1 Tax=Babesia gibsoni TaxID=33632 RepID=A0AAD8PDC6_BABGI|nr:hypothetical protein BgAZ_502930 [Babesia gibsoni]
MKASFSAFLLSLFLASKSSVFAEGTDGGSGTGTTTNAGTGTTTTTTTTPSGTGVGGSAGGSGQAAAAAAAAAKPAAGGDKEGFSYAVVSASILGSTIFVLA